MSADIDTETRVMAVRGRWDVQLGREVLRAVGKCMSEHPLALIFDLAALHDPAAASAPTWIHSWRLARAMDPPVEALVCAPPRSVLAERLHRQGSDRPVPVFGSLDTARAARVAGPGSPGSPPRFRLSLPQRTESVHLARDLVSDACAAWDLPGLLDRSRLVISELAANAVRHARPPITVLVSRRGHGLHLVVGDGDPHLPRFLRPCPVPGRAATPPVSTAGASGQGLRVVEAAASRWGVLPTADGKMVWATVSPWLRRR